MLRRWSIAPVLCIVLALGARAHAQLDASAPWLDAGTPEVPIADEPADAGARLEAEHDVSEPRADAVVEEEAPVEVETAETPNLDGIEVMVVTAQRRKVKLQEAPISINAISGDALRERSAVDLGGVAEATPNMQLITSSQASGGSNFAQVFIRGVGQTDFYITKDPAVGLYVDGVYLARAPGALLELLDIERIEVLRGPQGTLFGKNTAGGAVSVVTKRPEGATSAVADLRLGSYGRRDVSGSFEVPVIDRRLYLRATGVAQHQDGYYERLSAGAIDSRTADGNSVGTYSGRATLRWEATDDLDVVVAADTTVQRQTGTDFQAIGITSPGNITLYNQQVLAPRGQVYDARWIAPRPWTTYSTTPSYNNTDVWGVSGTVTWELGALELKSITAFRKLRAAARTDADGTPFDIVASDGIVINQHQVSEELQLVGNAFRERLHWVLGLWYFQEKADDRQSSRQLVGLYESLEAAPPRSVVPPGMSLACPPDGTGAPACLGGAGNPGNARYDLTRNFARALTARSYAAFGQLSLRIVGPLSITAGARISREDKTFTYTETLPLQANRVMFDDLRVDPAWNVFTPKLGLEAFLTSDLMAYFSYSRGFKAGGITGRPTRADLFKAFDPEWLTAYELGVKSEWLDRRVRLNLAGFYSQYTDIQITRNTTDAQGMFVRLEDNAGDGRIFGFEAEATVVPVRGLTVSAGMGYTDFEFTSLLPQQAAPGIKLLTLQTQLPFTPKLTVVAGAAYRIALGASGGSLTPRLDLNYNSGYATDIDNTPEITQGRFTTLGARLAYAPASERWELFFAGTNLSERAIVAAGVYGPANGSQVVSYRAPRMLYGGVRVSFD